MKRKLAVSSLVAVGISSLLTWNFLKTEGKDADPKKDEKTATQVQVSPKSEDLEKTIASLGKMAMPTDEDVRKQMEETGSERVEQRYKAFEESKRAYERSFSRYQLAHDRYREAVHADAEGDAADVSSALAEVDQLTEDLQAETEKVNAASAVLIEEYRKAVYEKFGLADNE